MTGEMSSAGTAGPTGTGQPFGMMILPVLWIALVAGLSAHGIAAMWPATYELGLPDDVEYWLYSEMVVAVITILWAMWLLGSAYRRSPGFPRAFTVWQCFRILVTCVSLGYTLASDVFVATASSFAYPAVEVAVGIALIVLLNRSPTTSTVFTADGNGTPPALVLVINAFLGMLLGGAAGMVLGFLAGALLVDVYDVSCFEGACGYFAAAIGLLGMIIGAIAGIIGAVWLTRRLSRQKTAS